MKVLVIPSWYPEGNDKLMGIYHKDYCKAISDNVDVDMLYIYRQSIKYPIKYLFMKKYEIDDEKAYKVYKHKMLDFSKINYDLQMHLYYKKVEKAYKKYIKNHSKPDILHAQVIIPAGYAVAKLGKKYNIPVVVTEHSSGFMKYFEGKDEKYSKYVLENAKMSTVSNYMKKEIDKMTSGCEVLPNLVDTSIYNKKKKKKDKTLRLVCVSAFRVGKCIEDLINAVYILVKEKKIDVHLDLVGDGYLMDYYKTVAKDLGVEDYITFHGKKTRDEISSILSNNDIFVVSSRLETFCIPGVEALASGLPVVSTSCLGPEEYIDEKCGELCKINNPVDMAEKIIKVSMKLDKYDTKYLKQVANRYSGKEISNKALKIYKEMCKNK